MGAADDGRYYRIEPRKGAKGTGAMKTAREIRIEVEDRFRFAQEQDGWENGHQYSGTIASCGMISGFLDKRFTDGTCRNDTELRRIVNDRHGGDEVIKPSTKMSGAEKAMEYAVHAGERGDPLAVSYVYSPGKGKRKRIGWAVGAMCPS